MRKLKKRAIDFDIFCFLMAYIIAVPTMLIGGIFMNTSIIKVGLLIDLLYGLFLGITDIVEWDELGFAIFALVSLNALSLIIGVLIHGMICYGRC